MVEFVLRELSCFILLSRGRSVRLFGRLLSPEKMLHYSYLPKIIISIKPYLITSNGERAVDSIRCEKWLPLK